MTVNVTPITDMAKIIEMAKTGNLFVINNVKGATGYAGNYHLPIKTERGDSISINLPNTWLPVDLASFAEPVDIAKTPIFRQAVAQKRTIVVLTMEEALEILESPEARMEKKRINNSANESREEQLAIVTTFTNARLLAQDEHGNRDFHQPKAIPARNKETMSTTEKANINLRETPSDQAARSIIDRIRTNVISEIDGIKQLIALSPYPQAEVIRQISMIGNLSPNVIKTLGLMNGLDGVVERISFDQLEIVASPVSFSPQVA